MQEIKDFFQDTGFLADFAGKLSDLNLQLQGKSKPISELINAIGAFKMQIPSFISDLKEKRFDFVPNIIQNYPDCIWEAEKYVAEIN